MSEKHGEMTMAVEERPEPGVEPGAFFDDALKYAEVIMRLKMVAAQLKALNKGTSQPVPPITFHYKGESYELTGTLRKK